MVVGGSRQETLNSGFVLLGTRQQDVPVILRELVLPGGFNMVAEDSQQETLDTGFVLIGTCQQDLPVILRELILPDRFDVVSLSFIVRDVTAELSEPRLLTSCGTEICLQLIDCHVCQVLLSADRILSYLNIVHIISDHLD
ncbi:unnamed protein product [Schistosoma curassoni]|uniref:Secreted protein n=1 Tax=Schistosoma curassoni TaxID=6186 RepID=A0A183KH99_9TREM|nr:unnamed protein product [Schistosoma curassoni]